MPLGTLKRRLRPGPLIRELEIRELIARGLQFRETLERTKSAISPADFGWYPWDSFGTLVLLDKLLTGRHRFLRPLIGTEPVLDLGCGDGDLAFLFESIGCRVYAIDHPLANFNQMRGVAAIRAALASSIRISALDLDRGGQLPVRRSGLALFLGLLYHLKNPLGALEMLAGVARYCLLSTAVTRFAPGQPQDVNALPAAFLAGRNGLRGDETNYWIFTEAGLRALVDRAGWDVCDWLLVRDEESVLWNAQTDERVLCLLRSRAFEPVPRTQLAAGWHVLEADAWRWTERRFSVALDSGVSRVALQVTVPPILPLPITLTVKETSEIAELRRHGDYDLTFCIPPARTSVEFELDRALAPDARDGRERGIVVRGIEAG